MIDFETASEKVLEHTPVLGMKSVSLNGSFGYILAENIHTKEPVPLFDSSAVDGYAVKVADVQAASGENPVPLRLDGTIRAGDPPAIKVKEGSVVKILTGAPVPKSADAVVMQEYTEERDGKVFVKYSAASGENMRRAGEEFGKGEIVFSPGKVITPPVVGMLATLGHTKIKVYKKPSVAMIITGDELRPPSAKLKRGQIRDSNSYALAAAVRSMGVGSVDVIRCKDSVNSVRASFVKALKKSDLILSVGGVSVGEYDLVKDVLGELGVKQIFWKVAMKPGKPNYFGMKKDKLIFGLPGNPVSAMVSFFTLVRPAILKLMGAKEYRPLILKARLASLLRKKPGRLEFVRGFVRNDENGELIVSPSAGQDSHMMGGLAGSNCLIYFPKEDAELPASSLVNIQLLHWGIG